MPRFGSRRACSLLVVASLICPAGAVAQDAAAADVPIVEIVPPSPAYLDDSNSPFGKVEVTNEDAAKLEMPKLAFAATPEDTQNFDKYYYFTRAETDFTAAYLDIVECDGYARGLWSGIAYQQTPYPYAGTMAGAVGGAIGNALAVAIFGSAEKRRLRRVNMRQCMNFKGYSRHGLSKTLWEEFNFEEGLSDMPESRRFDYLRRQALVASSAKAEGELGL